MHDIIDRREVRVDDLLPGPHSHIKQRTLLQRIDECVAYATRNCLAYAIIDTHELRRISLALTVKP